MIAFVVGVIAGALVALGIGGAWAALAIAKKTDDIDKERQWEHERASNVRNISEKPN